MKKWSFNRNNARRYTETTSAVFQSHSCQKNHLYCNSFFFFPNKVCKNSESPEGEKETLKEGSWASRVAQQVKVACWAGLGT